MFDSFEQTQINTSGATIHLVKGGNGFPLLLLHGYPETHLMWHKIAPRLAEEFTVIAPDLRGYGDSSKPEGGADHYNYSKRAMAQDMVEVMIQLGFEEFFVVGHDRGARVGHRMTLDHPQRVKKLAVLDIAPTYKMYMTADKAFATAYYHWFFLIQPYDLPERLIGAQPEYYLRKCLTRWSADAGAFTPEVVEEYLRCFSNPAPCGVRKGLWGISTLSWRHGVNVPAMYTAELSQEDIFFQRKSQMRHIVPCKNFCLSLNYLFARGVKIPVTD